MIKLKLKQLLLITIISLSVSLFGKGSDETKKDTDGNTVGFISVGQSFGLRIYNFNDLSTSKEVKYIVMEINGVYYNQSNDRLYNQTFFGDLLSDITTRNSRTVKHDDKDITLEDGKVAIDESEFIDVSIIKEEGSCIKIKSSIEPIDIKAWMITESGNLTQISATLTPTFFDGEDTFFDEENTDSDEDNTDFPKLFKNKPKLSYNMKIIFFLSTFFTEETKDNDENVISIKADTNWTYFVENSCSVFDNINSIDIPKISDIITTQNFDDLYPELVKYQKIFKASFASHFLLEKEKISNKDSDHYIGREAKLPYIDIKAESFDSIYGNKNPYISIYLNYIFLEDKSKSKKSKPILSYLINKKINENSNNKIMYNYTQYRQVTVAEGESIAKSALRYMTWGLEYAPETTSELSENDSDSGVYYTNPEGINSWVKYNGEVNSKRLLNYFSGDINILKKPLFLNPIDSPDNLYTTKMLTSPFDKQGNPIAYSAMGIDTPKTFNYKMVRQHEARDWMLINRPDIFYYKYNFPQLYSNYTGIAVKRFQRGYLNEINLYAEAGVSLSQKPNNKYDIDILPSLSDGLSTVEPFLPGIRSKNSKQYVESTNSMYHPNKVAGVDSLGLLMGSLTMADVTGAFLNVFNTKVDEQLDEYNRSLPKFHVTDTNNILKKPYRFTRTDIERSTVLVPDLALARTGDILVKFSDKEPIIGVIVSTNFTTLTSQSTVEDYMKNITVVSINSGFRMANIGVWLGDNNIYGGFSKLGDEKSYYLRRLLIQPENTTNISYEKDNFELFDSELLGLDIDLVHEVENEPWIPNTGELYKFKKIVIKGLYSGELSTLYDDDKKVEILPPLDMYRTDYENDASNDIEVGSNIYQNKGKGLKFYAIDGNNAILLATFILKKGADLTAVQPGNSPYDVVYNGDIFKLAEDKITTISTPKDDFDLLVANNKLTFKLKNGEALTKFAVRPIENNIRPGDDFLLRFGKRNSLNVKGTSKEEDFVAVYDKKLLWRANLFIQENNDWNDIESHKWNAPPIALIFNNMGKALNNIDYYDEFGFVTVNGSSNTSEIKWYGYNEWNRSVIKLNSAVNENDGADKFGYTGNEFDGSANWENLSNIDGGDGKQVVKNIPSSIYRHSDGTNRLYDDAVTYCYARTSTPFEFYYQMTQQNLAMQEAETNGIALYNNIDDSTLPPESDWDNYIDSSYRPGFKDVVKGTALNYTSETSPFKQESEGNLESGIDCGGLIYASEMYEGTPYKRLENTSARDGSRVGSYHDAVGNAEQWEGEDLSDNDWDSNGFNAGSNNLWKVVRIDNLDDELYSDKLSFVIPGDIVYYITNAGYHVMMVQSVELVERSRKTSIDSIQLIESTVYRGLEMFGVAKKRALERMSQFDDNRRNWHIGRLKTGE